MQVTNAARQINMKVIPAPPEKKETMDERNTRLGRVLSPHLTIYKPQLTSFLSISHRMTGLAWSVYVTAFGLGALMSSQDFQHYVTMIEGLEMNGTTLVALKVLLGYPAAFHTANGVRHLLWDTGRFLKIGEVYTTGYVMIAASIVLAGIIAAL